MITAKYYQLIADILNDSRDGRKMERDKVINGIARVFAARFEEQSSRFDRNRFLKACGNDEPKS